MSTVHHIFSYLQKECTDGTRPAPAAPAPGEQIGADTIFRGALGTSSPLILMPRRAGDVVVFAVGSDTALKEEDDEIGGEVAKTKA